MLDGHQHSVSIQISINLGKKFLCISRIRKIAVIRILAKVFAYIPAFISQILDFTYWPVLILILIYFVLRDTENQQSLKRTLIYKGRCGPGEGCTPGKIGRGCVACFPKSSPYLWPKSAIFPTLFMTWPFNKNQACFRPALQLLPWFRPMLNYC